MPMNQIDAAVQTAKAALAVTRIINNADEDTLLRNLLCDLMHWCAHHNLDFGAECDAAYSAYLIEAREADLKNPSQRVGGAKATSSQP